jgi:hypothetical protein
MTAALKGRGVMIFAAIGAGILFLAGFLPILVAAVIAGGALFLAVTNFGRSCPLFLSVRAFVARKRFLRGERQK